jgi:hypothetical protein
VFSSPGADRLYWAAAHLEQNPDRRALAMVAAGSAGRAPGTQAAACALPGARATCPDAVTPPITPARLEYQSLLADVVSEEVFFAMRPVHQRMLLAAREAIAKGLPPIAFCFTPDTPADVADAFNRAMYGEIPAFNVTNRWSQTAVNGTAVGSQGGPITLTYSFPPDGTPITAGSSFPAGTNALQARMRAIYGTDAAWQQIYHDMFADWGAVTGVNYVFEPNDDGGTAGSGGLPGAAGVRGDLRMVGMPLDGNSGVLAYNNFPNGGDMVVDTNDTFYDNVSFDSIRLRNVLFHEHGHGLGILHVCPRTNTKLMEPFISTAFFGPQTDDVLAAQRLYGDNSEPNDGFAQATPIANADATLRTLDRLSLDGTSDMDTFAVTVNGPARLTVTARPRTGAYLSGPQNTNCDGGTNFDPATVNDLTLRIFAPNQVTVLATANAGGPGTVETASAGLATTGTLWVRVTPGATDNIQAYALEYRVRPGLIDITFPNGVPELVEPGQPTSFDVNVEVLGDTEVNAPFLAYRTSPAGGYSTTPLTPLGGTLYRATLPAFSCEQSPAFFVSMVGLNSGQVFGPNGNSTAPDDLTVGEVVTAFSDDAETNQGWTLGGVAGDTATSGRWVRADPVGTTSNNAAVNPEDDNTPAPGVNCFFTGQGTVGGQAGAADVDGGRTTLISPVFDLAGATSARVAFARWYSNSRGGAPNADVFTIDISNNNGSTWVNARTIGPTGAGTDGGWIADSFEVLPLIAPTAQMRLRFIAEDAGTGSLVEAAVDDVVVTKSSCTNPPTCPADFDASGTVDPDDLADFIAAFFSTPPGPGADFDASGTVNPDDLADFIGAFFTPCP